MNQTIRRVLQGAALTAAVSLTGLALAGQDFRSRASHEIASVGSLASDIKAELDFGRDVAAHILGRYGMREESEITRYVNLVGRSVALHGNRSDIEHRFAILDSETINAYAAPGGYVFITWGALQAMNDESELAGALAHEVAHVNQRHIVRALNIHGTEDGADTGLSRLVGASADPTRVAFAQAVDKAVALLFETGLERQDELEADRVGTMILASTGYDATALRRYLDRLGRKKGKQMDVLHSTHPPFDVRLTELDRLIAAEQLGKYRGPTVKSRFMSIMP